MTDNLTPETVARYDLDQPDSHMGSATMKREDGYGDWVRFTDYEAIAAKLAEVEADNADLRLNMDADLKTMCRERAALQAAEAEVARLRKDRDRYRTLLQWLQEFATLRRSTRDAIRAALQPKETDHE